jgi:hypothetical protein
VKGGLGDFERFVSCIREFLSKDPISDEDPDMAELEFRYHKLSADEKSKLLNALKARLEGVDEVVFAYVYGGFLEREVFRDVDVAVWIKDVEKAFYYTVDFSVKLGVDTGLPVDVQVLNQAPLPFKYHIFTRGRLLLSKDEGLRLRIADEVIRKYFDLSFLNKHRAERKPTNLFVG